MMFLTALRSVTVTIGVYGGAYVTTEQLYVFPTHQRHVFASIMIAGLFLITDSIIQIFKELKETN